MKKAYFFIDDVIWCFRDLTRQRPASIFDHPFLKGLKEAHDKYGMKVQLNLFCRTDYFYGSDEFCLHEMTDAYKEEFTAASDWLRFGFHAKQEFPVFPHVNADYEDVKSVLDYTKKHVVRFASEANFSPVCMPHWICMSKDGCKALRDGGIRLLGTSSGEVWEVTNENKATLPEGYGKQHIGRLLHNRKPDAKFWPATGFLASYNHLDEEGRRLTNGTFNTHYDPETDLHFKVLGCGTVLDEHPAEEACEILRARVAEGHEFITYVTHEGYFYPNFFFHQPEYMAKIHGAAKIMSEAGYTYFFPDELIK